MRTSTDQAARIPVVVTIGGVEVHLHPKTYSQAVIWRRKVKDLFRDVIESVGKDFETDGGFIGSIMPDFLDAPEKMLEALKAWEAELEWDEIIEGATDDEILAAFWEVAQMAYPLLRSLKASWLIETIRLISGMSQASMEQASPSSAKVSAGISTAPVMH